MSSFGSKSHIPTNALYTNIVAAPSSIFLEDGTTVAPWLIGMTAATTAGGLLVRDMGKTLYVPAPTTPSEIGSQSTILRKVQLVPTNGFYGTGGSSETTSEYYTGYIKIGGQTYGGGAPGPATFFVRAN